MCILEFIKSTKEVNMNYCYVLQCNDGSYYTGWTNDIGKRYKAHSEGKGAKYTKGRGPLKLVMVEEYETKEQAMKREYQLKHLTRRQKEKIIDNWQLNNVGLIDSYIDDIV